MEITVVLVRATDADFLVFVQLVAIVCLRHHVYFRNVQRNLVGTIVLHRTNQFAVAEGVVAGKFDFADFDLRSFIDFEDQNYRVAGSDAFVLRTDFRKLPTVFAQQFLDHHFRFFDFGGIELAFHAEADFAFLEAIKNIGFRNGVNIVVANAPDDRTFLNFKNNDLGVGAVRRFFHAQFYVLKELSIPKSLKIAAQRLLVVDVVFAAENPGFQGIIAHPPVAGKIDALDDLAPSLLLCCLWAVIRSWMTFVKNDFAGQQI